jgi:hypothetical protein
VLGIGKRSNCQPISRANISVWYEPGFYSFFHGEFGGTYSTPGRSLISQELSTGYPRQDGWASRSYIYHRYVPQALVGNYAFEQNDPTIFMTKELTEVIRRAPCHENKTGKITR